MIVSGLGLSHIGNSRPNNEDYFIADNDLSMYIICDGVGGNRFGEVASKMAAETCKEYIYAHRSTLEEYYRKGTDSNLVCKLVESALLASCAKVFHAGQKNIQYKGMASTMTVLLMLNQKAVMGHVGDSRLYLLRKTEVHQVTDDHSLGNEMMERGRMNEAEVKEKKYAHVLSRAIGIQESTRVDTLFFDILPGDRFILCTDGFHTYVRSPYELFHLTKASKQKDVIEGLIDFALRRGGTDNVTAVYVQNKLEESSYKHFSLGKHELLNDFSLLRKIYLFKDLNFSRINRVFNVCKFFDYKQGEVVAEQGTDPNLRNTIYA